MKGTTILSDLLGLLKVKHTGDYTDGRFRTMPFKSLFGFSRLLKEYGVESQGLQLADKTQIRQLPTPFLAQLGTAFVIVTGITDGSSPRVNYLLYHDKLSLPFEEFCNKMTGTVLLVYPTSEAKEPEYGKHHFYAVAGQVKTWLLIACVLFLGVVGIIEAGIGKHLSLIILLATDIAGLAVCWMLILKSQKIKTHAADKFCGILQKHGCDTVLEQKASTFYGLFSWSEVGLAYFTVSTLLLFLFPGEAKWLALINGCCLPFTVWSISYQKFVIKSWCTLCVTVQTLLWCQFFCFLCGGWWHGLWPLGLPLFEMGAAYVAALLGLNRLMNWINSQRQK